VVDILHALLWGDRVCIDCWLGESNQPVHGRSGTATLTGGACRSTGTMQWLQHCTKQASPYHVSLAH